ncbi:GDSL-type esterase/lipase family protein [Nonomuraea roseoviolacea]|uniref:Lysophospholipase L1-like esterase n=1 Tax=Nonomuraea roseoviolacea subsp. carminata TaxID=160689 RepID=A0ABT1KE02_9ACTN|nr:GDSL-type esterase/lipase family protein [Nonomuraea roseoviolacea]MCP2352246.1 lysophospholipase L1-like esterase [Nonomuraea roseoviolacea subsp. carminata]
MIPRLLAAALLLSGSGVLCGAGPATAATGVPVPTSMVALGDSISSGFNACGWYVSCTSRSWSAGDNAEVASHYRRLLRLDDDIQGHNRNLAVPGSTSAGLMSQVRQAVELKPGYVTILIGAQDACVGTEREMTPVTLYRQRLDAALAALRDGVPGVRVFLASIPDLRRLWQVGRSHALARTFWTAGHICQSMLARPASVKRADVARRARVRERVMAYNEQAAEACAALGDSCRTDGGAIFRYRFTLDHISKWDFFHPNAAGQRVLAEETFSHGFEWSDDTDDTDDTDDRQDVR